MALAIDQMLDRLVRDLAQIGFEPDGCVGMDRLISCAEAAPRLIASATAAIVLIMRILIGVRLL